TALSLLGAVGIAVWAPGASARQPMFQPLGYVPGHTYSDAAAISADGTTIAGFEYRWTAATGWQSLGPLPGSSSTSVWSVSGDGSVIVGETRFSGVHAFRWTAPTGIVDMGVPPGSMQSWAHGISADGGVICGH